MVQWKEGRRREREEQERKGEEVIDQDLRASLDTILDAPLLLADGLGEVEVLSADSSALYDEKRVSSAPFRKGKGEKGRTQGVEPTTLESGPRPRFEKDFQMVQAFSPPVRALSAARMASRAFWKEGRQGWIFIPSMTSCRKRVPSVRSREVEEGGETHLNSESVAVLGDLLASLVEVSLRVVAVRVGSVRGRREKGRVEAVVVDEILSEREEELGPNLTDRVNAPVAGLVEELRGGGASAPSLERGRVREGRRTL